MAGIRRKVTHKEPEKFTGTYDGKVTEIASLTALPKNVPMLERTTLQEVLDAYKARTGKLPAEVFQFNRTMGPDFYIIMEQE